MCIRDRYIMDYNRVVKDLNGLTKEQFLEKLEHDCTVEPYLGEGPCSPPQKHSFGMYLDGQWYLLRAKEGSFDANEDVYKRQGIVRITGDNA